MAPTDIQLRGTEAKLRPQPKRTNLRMARYVTAPALNDRPAEHHVPVVAVKRTTRAASPLLHGDLGMLILRLAPVSVDLRRLRPTTESGP